VTAHSAYEAALADGRLKPDSDQLQVWMHLENLKQRLAEKPKSIWQRLTHAPYQIPRGLYIHGDVGRGKTILMDLFFNSLTGVSKRRVHFHAFMQDVHAKRKILRSDDVISTIADEFAHDTHLLCLDEMQITDIADAMIIGRLFEALAKRGVCLVTTSNLPPEDLYRDGLNRQLFLPFIAKLRSSLNVVALDSKTDYRLGRIRARDTFLHPATAANRVAFNAIWNDLTDTAPGRPEQLDVLGRKLTVPKTAHSCAAFTFNELCKEALGPPDYLALTKAYRTVFVSGIAKLETHQRNEAKRFIVMIDTFYDAGTRLVALADCAPEQVVPKGQHAFEFKRTVSRLKEMQSTSWWHNP
jgi:cell division protein ZapE